MGTTKRDLAAAAHRALLALKEQVGSFARLAGRLDSTDRTVRTWYNGGPSVLASARKESLERIMSLARELGIEIRIEADNPVLWNPELSYQDNYPFALMDARPEREDLPPLGDVVFGHSVVSPWGPSSSIMTSCPERISFFADTNNGVITTKTVRTIDWGAHLWPNIYYLAGGVPELDPDSATNPEVCVRKPENGSRATDGMVNRYGMPSPKPDEWQYAYSESLAAVGGSLLIASVVGTMRPGFSDRDLAQDFARCATLAAEAGATVVELNMSCPNSRQREALAYQDLGLSTAVVRACRKALPETQIVAKIGYLGAAELAEFVRTTQEHLNGYTAINTIPVRAYREGLEGPVPAFEAAAPAGLSGAPLREIGLRMMGQLSELRSELRRDGDLTLLAAGGVSEPEHVQHYLNRGANAVQGTTVFMDNPYFGLDVHRFLAARRPHEEAQRLRIVREGGLAFLEAAEESGIDEDEELMAEAIRQLLQWRRHVRAARAGSRAQTKQFWLTTLALLRRS